MSFNSSRSFFNTWDLLCLPPWPNASFHSDIHPSRDAVEALPDAFPVFNVVSRHQLRGNKLLHRSAMKIFRLCNLIPLKSEETTQNRHRSSDWRSFSLWIFTKQMEFSWDHSYPLFGLGQHRCLWGWVCIDPNAGLQRRIGKINPGKGWLGTLFTTQVQGMEGSWSHQGGITLTSSIF